LSAAAPGGVGAVQTNGSWLPPIGGRTMTLCMNSLYNRRRDNQGDMPWQGF
jgi:protein involved in sex pheromone biosynthesis